VPVGGYAAVYDLGGGTFDAAVVRRTGEDSFEVVGEPRGVDDLGGELFDQRLQERLRQTLAHQSEEASATLTDSVRLRHEFLSKVRHAKERLARSPSASFAVHGLPDFHVTREEFDGLIRAYIEESAGILEATVREALGDAGELSAVFLVGGSSRIQLVADTLRARARFAGKVVAAPGDPKSVVALGAARYVPQAEPGPAELRAPDDLLALLRLWQGGVLPAVERRSQALAEALGELTTPERIAGDRLELRLRFDMTRFSTAAEALADAAFQERLLDCVAETDERLMERYLSGELIEPEAALRELVGDIRLRAALFEVTRARLVPRIDVPRSGQPLPGVLTQDAPLAPAALSAAGHEKLRGFDAALHAEFERAAQSLGADAEVAWGELHPSAAAHIRQSPLGADTESDAVSAEKIQWWISLAQRRAAGGGIQWHAMSSSERADLLTIVAVRGRVFLQDDLPPDPRPAFRNLTLASGDCRTKAPLDRLVPELAHAVDPSERLHVALVGWESFESYGTPSGFGRRPPRGQRAFRIFCTSRGRFIIARTKAVIDDRAAPPDVQPAAILEADLPPVSVTQEDLFRCELEGFHRPSRSGTLLTGHVRLHLAARDLDKRLWGRRRSLSGMAFRFAHYWDDEVEVLRYALRELRPEPGRGL
jgi:hypothetical protein